MILKKQEGELPQGYTKVDYLQNSGTEYILLENIVPDDKLQTIITFQMNNDKFNYTNNNRFPVAKYEANNMRYRPIKIYSLNNIDFRFEIQNSNAARLSTFSGQWDKHTLSFNEANHYYSWDGVQYRNSVIATSLKGHNNVGLGVFGQSHATAYMQDTTSVSMKLYSLEFYDNTTNELIDKFICCLDNKRKPCLYGIVSKITYYNIGTGEFTYGWEA